MVKAACSDAGIAAVAAVAAIRIGNIMPYSSPASVYDSIDATEEPYFRRMNVEGGISGRKMSFISQDDGYVPPKAVEQARKLVENDNVVLVFNPLGALSNTAGQGYLNQKGVPHLLLATGATKCGDYSGRLWTIGWRPIYQGRGGITANIFTIVTTSRKLRCCTSMTILAKIICMGQGCSWRQ